MRRIFYITILSLLGLIFQQDAFAEPGLVYLHDGENDYLISSEIRYIKGDPKWETAAQVMSLDEDRFSRFEKDRYVLPPNRDLYWVKFRVENGSKNNDSWSLASLGTEADVFRIYKIDQKGIPVLVSDRSLDAKIKYPETSPHVSLPIDKGEVAEFLVEIKQMRFNVISFHVAKLEFNQLRLNKVWGFLLLYSGCMLGLIGYNLFLFWSLKDKAYFWYVCFAASMLFGVGLTTRVLAPMGIHLGEMGLNLAVVLLATVPGCASMFCRSFLKLKNLSTFWDKFAQGLFLVAIMNALGIWFVAHEINFKLIMVCNILVFILVGVSSVKAIRTGFAPAYYYLLSWLIFFVSVVYWTLGQTNLVLADHINAHSAIFGNMLEMVTMSLALGRRVKALEDEKIEASRKAKEGESYRRLVRILCHDIANPLSIILGNATIGMDQNKDNPMAFKFFEKVERAGIIVSDLIDSVRKLEKQKSSSTKLVIGPVSLKEAINHIEFVFATKLSEKDIRLDLEPLKSDVRVIAEAHTLHNEVLSNVISNAIKFSHPGGNIEFTVRINKRKVIIGIRDFGIGMPEEVINDLFNHEVAKSRQGTNNEVGTGFGMPLVQDFMAIYGGTVTVNSLEENNCSEGEVSGTLIELGFSLAS